MKLSQNSVSTVLFSTREGKRNDNDPKEPTNPDAPDLRRLGFCILREGRRTYWNAAVDLLLTIKKPRLSQEFTEWPELFSLLALAAQKEGIGVYESRAH